MHPSDVFGTPEVFDSVFENIAGGFTKWAVWIFLGYFVVLPLIGEVIRGLIKRAFWALWRRISDAVWPRRPTRYSTESYVDELRHEHGD